jgi:hypothetical protein
MFSGCPSDVGSLACVGRCQFSDRVWNPGERISAKASFMTYACAPSWCAACNGGCARETFESAGFLRSPGSNLRTAATPSRGTEWISFNVPKEKDIMIKPTPNPPEATAEVDTDPTSPYASIDTKKLHEAAERALDFYLNPAAQVMATPYTPNDLFYVNPKADTETPAGQRLRIPGLGYRHARRLRRAAGRHAPQDTARYRTNGDAGRVGGEQGAG